jgi:formate hydrogenlyase subunit 3/multisubunit Na+/H+ antiporter MnhD subunit
MTSTAAGSLLPLTIILPVGGVLFALLLGGRTAERIALAVMPAGIVLSAAIAVGVWRSRGALTYFLGGWAPPAGIALRADGFSVAMLAAMFLAAGIVAETLERDRISGLRGIGRALPMTAFAFELGGMSLMGLPPSGGGAAKWLLLTAAVESGQWPWAAVMLIGGLLAAGYVFRALAPALAGSNEPPLSRSYVSPGKENLALALALCATLIGFAPPELLELLQIGRPVSIMAVSQ